MATQTKSEKVTTPETTEAEVVSVEETRSEVTVFPGLNNDDMAMLDTFEEAIRIASHAHGGIIVSDDFIPIEKEELVGREFLIMNFEKGTKAEYKGREYVVVKIMVKKRNDSEQDFKAVFTDGSTGVCKTLMRYLSMGRTGGIHVQTGLKKSEYNLNEHDKPAKEGEEVHGKGVTYYL